jgi:hypothetical protein
MTDDLDVCVCGDYRRQHDERGWCKLNGLGHGGAEDCHKFTLFLTARELLILRASDDSTVSRPNSTSEGK